VSRDYEVAIGYKQKVGCKQTWSYRNEIVSQLGTENLLTLCPPSSFLLGVVAPRNTWGVLNASRDYLWLARQCRTILFTILRSELVNSSQLTETSRVAFTCNIRIETVQAAFSTISNEGGDDTVNTIISLMYIISVYIYFFLFLSL